MRWSTWAAFLVLGLLLGLGCSQREDPTDPVDEVTVLRGRVVDSSGGEALAGVVVRVEGTNLSAVTATDGTFEIRGVPGGEITLVVEPSGDTPYQSNRIEITVRPGDTVSLDCTVLPDGATPGPFAIYPVSARVGVLESVQLYIGTLGGWPEPGNDGQGRFPFRPTWSIRSAQSIGVVSREGIFIGTAPGRGQIVASLSNELVATAEIEVVSDGDLARIVVLPRYATEIPEGETRYFAAYGINGAGAVAHGASFTWSVDPAFLGTVEPASDLTPEEREAILARLWYGWEGGWSDPGIPVPGDGWPDPEDSTGTTPPDGGGTGPWPPVPPEIDADDIELVRFTASGGVAGEARGALVVAAAGAAWTQSIDIAVVARGMPTTLYLRPEEARLAVGGETWFFAYAVNEWDRPIDGVTYTWSIEPASLGSLFDLTESPHPSGSQGILFRAGREGEGTIHCVATDPVTGRSLEKTATIQVAPAPALHRIEVRPDRIEIAAGDSILVQAVALNTWGEIDATATISWSLAGDAGVFVPLERPNGVEVDSTGSGGWPGDPPGDDPTDPPDPDERYGMAFGIFVAQVPGRTGTLTATAASENGVTVDADIPIRVRPR